MSVFDLSRFHEREREREREAEEESDQEPPLTSSESFRRLGENERSVDWCPGTKSRTAGFQSSLMASFYENLAEDFLYGLEPRRRPGRP